MRLITLVLSLTAFLPLALLSCGSPKDPLQECLRHQGVLMHIHPHLALMVEGKPVKIPANVGIAGECMRPLHTHDDSGTIHIEYKQFQDFTLGDFFRVWQDYPYRGRPVVRAWVEEQPYLGDYAKLVLKDGQRIVLYYGPAK